MVRPNRLRSASPALALAIGTLLFTGCALLQPPPVPSVPHLGWRRGSTDASCTADVARAHAAFAAAGAAAGDPTATALAHADAAAAMASYHTCLAGVGRP